MPRQESPNIRLLISAVVSIFVMIAVALPLIELKAGIDILSARWVGLFTILAAVSGTIVFIALHRRNRTIDVLQQELDDVEGDALNNRKRVRNDVMLMITTIGELMKLGEAKLEETILDLMHRVVTRYLAGAIGKEDLEELDPNALNMYFENEMLRDGDTLITMENARPEERVLFRLAGYQFEDERPRQRRVAGDTIHLKNERRPTPTGRPRRS